MPGLGPWEVQTQGPELSPRFNQIHFLPLDRPNPYFVEQKQPNGVIFADFSDFFNEVMGTEDFTPIKQANLPDWFYKNRRGGHHTGREQQHQIWGVTPLGRYVGPIHQLLDELTSRHREGHQDLHRSALWHQHWEGIRGGAPSAIVVGNTLGHKIAKVVVDVAELVAALNLDNEDPDRANYFFGLCDKLGVTA